jgi:hypothetical protein
LLDVNGVEGHQLRDVSNLSPNIQFRKDASCI